MSSKALAIRLAALCKELWPDEWRERYTGSREDMRNWLNEKTGLNVDHISDRDVALSQWIEKLEEIKAGNANN